MTEHQTKSRWVVPMTPRSKDEAHRVSTPLELFFDLVFVVAISTSSGALHHGIAEGHTMDALVTYLMTFFGIWWAWINFTWFASSYDTDDVPYRLTVFVQMTGALILAAGVSRVVESRDLSIVVAGYVVMRVASVTQWVRAARSDPEHRPAAIRYGLGITVCQVGWVLLLSLPNSLQVPGFAALALAELLVPVWAERATPTTWHPHHIAERYGLFTIIVLGESILSAVVAIQASIEVRGFNTDLIPTIIGGLLIVYTIWWLYFYQPAHDLLDSVVVAFIWGYGQLFIFAAIAAIGSGLALSVDQITHHAEISASSAALAVTIPTVVYLISLWVLQERPRARHMRDQLLFPVFSVLVLLTLLTDQAVLLTGLLLAVLLAIKLVRGRG